ncbi:hypothetical protein C6V06_02675 [Burkholderia gladioli]|nr:hypothetical protein C6V06_02675 [Burkholderia gladioli]
MHRQHSRAPPSMPMAATPAIRPTRIPGAVRSRPRRRLDRAPRRPRCWHPAARSRPRPARPRHRWRTHRRRVRPACSNCWR